MNIKEAKEQIKNAMTAYFTKNEYGEYVIPIEKQRPVFLIGAPGIGKTAVMEQIAAELGVGLVSYSMTHHTRQSALGLPFIEKKIYGGKEYSVSEYTMSEIIASVYDMIEETGKKEGILFLDEINCVSETLAPSILQFLQYKVFGRHRVPDGWIVVTAGNPPEYNNSVREFDIVTWDRLKRIDVEPDYEVWKEYAINKGTHPAITTYLDIKKGDFYAVESAVGGKSFVTARGWSDLSEMILLYEKNDLKVDKKLIGQYLQNEKIAKSFSIYYDLFKKYRSDYQINKILEGKSSDEIVQRASAAKFDERLALLGLLLDGLNEQIAGYSQAEKTQIGLLDAIKKYRVGIVQKGADYTEETEKLIKEMRTKLDSGRRSSSLSTEDQRVLRSVIKIFDQVREKIVQAAPNDPTSAFAVFKADYDERLKSLANDSETVGKALSNAFVFLEKAFGDGQEMLIFVTELTINTNSARFISRYGCKEYFAHNKELLFYERQKELLGKLGDLGLD